MFSFQYKDKSKNLRTRSKTWANIFVVAVVTLGMLFPAAPMRAETMTVTRAYDSQAARLMVELAAGTDPQRLAKATGGELVRTGPLNYCTLEFKQTEADPNLEAIQQETLRKVLEQDGVRSAAWSNTFRVDAVKTTAAITDPEYGLQWALKKVRADQAWEEGATGQGVIVAVIDTGVDLDHPDLVDENGKITNLVQGYDAFTRSAAKGAGQDDNGHGTAVAGLIAARNNGIGIIGVAYNAKIMPIKAMDQDGEGEDSIIADGIIWAVDHGAKIINMSIGSEEQAKVLDDAIDYAVDKGCLLVAASGNIKGFQTETGITQNTNTTGVAYPGAHPKVIAVSALDRTDVQSEFALTGPEVELSAPGNRILTDYWSKEETGYGYSTGTSIAAPFVAGAAALLWSKYPTLSESDIRQALIGSAIDLGEEGRDNGYGYGRVDMIRALKILQAQQSYSSPANLGWEGGIIYSAGTAEESDASLGIPAGTFPLTVDAMGRDKQMNISLSRIDSPGIFIEGITPASDTFNIYWGEALAERVVTLNLKLEPVQELENQPKLASLYRWSNSRWIRIGGGLPQSAQAIEVTIYEPGTYRAGWSLQPDITRLSGNDRINTALDIARQAFPTGTDNVIIARADDFPDALAGAPLAYKLHAPIFLTHSDQLPLEVYQGIQDLEPKKIFILGGVGAVSTHVETQLSALGYVTRIAGDNRYSTAAAVADTLSTDGEAVIVNGLNFPDAIAAASHAAIQGMPILLTPGDRLAPETQAALRRRSVTHTQVIGGTGVMKATLYAKLPSPVRISGTDRFATSAAVIQTNTPTGKLLYIATGLNFPDALTGGILAATNSSNILLLPQTGPTQAQIDLLQTLNDRKIIALGGEGAVSEKVWEQVQQLVR